jgi:hypothetical protein
MAGEYRGNELVIQWGGTVISSDFRTFGHDESSDEIDATAGNDARKVYLTGPIDDTISASFIDTTGNTSNWAALAVGNSGTLVYSPQGTAAGKPKYTCGTAAITRRNRDIPYDGAVSYDMTWRLKTDLTAGTN